MEIMTDCADGEPTEDWFLLLDPAWRPSASDDEPPAESVVGAWPVADGEVGRFRPNPAYVPADAEAPSDPLDAVLRLARAGEADTAALRRTLRGTLCDVALNGEDGPLVTTSPDGVLCVVVATAALRRERVRAPGWRRVDLDELVALLADDVDVLVNPAGGNSVRLTGDFLRETTLMDDDELAPLTPETLAQAAELRFFRWEPAQRT